METVDTVLVEDGRVVQCWRKKSKSDVLSKYPSVDEHSLVEFSTQRPVVGQLWDGLTLTNPLPQPEPVPATITFRQAVITAVSDEWFDEQEGRTWLQRNGIPGIVQATVDALPAEQQFAAEASLYGMTEVWRDDPITFAMVRAALESAAGEPVSDEDVIAARDDFFRRASQV